MTLTTWSLQQTIFAYGLSDLGRDGGAVRLAKPFCHSVMPASENRTPTMYTGTALI